MKLERVAFRLDGHDVSLGEALAASWLGSWTKPLEASLRDELAASALAAEGGVEAGEDEVEAALNAWRRDRDLIAADELEAWLDVEGLELDDLGAFLERRILAARRWRADALAEIDVEPGEILEALPSQAVFSGESRTVVEAFARRCVAPPPEGDAAEGRRAQVRRELLADRDADSLADLEDVAATFEVAEERLGWALEIEVSYRLFRDDVASFRKLEAALVVYRDQLMRFDLVSATCPTEDVARELLCCIRVDRDPFTRSAARAGIPCSRSEIFAADLAALPFGHRVQAAQSRDIFGPSQVGRAHVVAQLLERYDPDLSTAGVAAWLSEQLIERALRKPFADRVRFATPTSA